MEKSWFQFILWLPRCGLDPFTMQPWSKLVFCCTTQYCCWIETDSHWWKDINYYSVLKSASKSNREMSLRFYLEHKVNTEVLDLWEWRVRTIIVQLFLYTRCLAYTWRNVSLPKICVDVNSIKMISNLSQDKNKDLESWLWVARWDLHRPVLLLSLYLKDFHHFLLHSSTVLPHHWTFKSFTSLWAPYKTCLSFRLFLFVSCIPSLYRKNCWCSPDFWMGN